jgi:transcription elongation factor Spt5
MSRRFWTEDKIVMEIRKLHDQDEDLWYRAMERNHKDLIRASERYFKGWKNAVIAAGLDYNSIKKRSHQIWTKDKIIEQLNDLRIEHKTLKSSTVQKSNKKLYHAAIRTFKNFNSAMEEVEKKYGKWKDQKRKKLPPEPVAKKQPKKTESAEEVTKTRKSAGVMKIFTVRTRVRSERAVGETIENRAKNSNIKIGTIQYPEILNGYIFVECDDREALNRLVRSVKNAQGLLNGETTSEEISKYVKSTRSKKVIIEGAKVEITEGQFKGSRAIIQHINDRTKEVTVELIDEIFKMPIKVGKKHVKAI